MKKTLDYCPIHGDYRWDGQGGHVRMNPHPTHIDNGGTALCTDRYIVWVDGIGEAIGQVATLEEAEQMLRDHRLAWLHR